MGKKEHINNLCIFIDEVRRDYFNDLGFCGAKSYCIDISTTLKKQHNKINRLKRLLKENK